MAFRHRASHSDNNAVSHGPKKKYIYFLQNQSCADKHIIVSSSPDSTNSSVSPTSSKDFFFAVSADSSEYCHKPSPHKTPVTSSLSPGHPASTSQDLWQEFTVGSSGDRFSAQALDLSVSESQDLGRGTHKMPSSEHSQHQGPKMGAQAESHAMTSGGNTEPRVGFEKFGDVEAENILQVLQAGNVAMLNHVHSATLASDLGIQSTTLPWQQSDGSHRNRATSSFSDNNLLLISPTRSAPNTQTESPRNQSHAISSSAQRKKSKSKISVSSNSDSGIMVESEDGVTAGPGTMTKTNHSKRDAHLCQVCGDLAAGFHCGAFVCEACKKFFVRSLKQDSGEKLTCSRQKSCLITKETRTQCQACRFQKCVKLGMYKPGTWPGGNVSAEMNNIPCKVCGAPSSGYHFGAITCEGCKGFFRRSSKERDGLKYVCSRTNNCNITTATRNICKACRFQKCLDMGMTQDGSRIGRQPNAVKHKTMLELQTLKAEGGLLNQVKSEPLSKCDSNSEGTQPEKSLEATIPKQLETTMNISPPKSEEQTTNGNTSMSDGGIPTIFSSGIQIKSNFSTTNFSSTPTIPHSVANVTTAISSSAVQPWPGASELQMSWSVPSTTRPGMCGSVPSGDNSGKCFVPAISSSGMDKLVSNKSCSRMMGPVPIMSSSRMMEPVPTMSSLEMMEPVHTMSNLGMMEPVPTMSSSRMMEPIFTMGSSGMIGPVPTMSSLEMIMPSSTMSSSRMMGPEPTMSSSGMIRPIPRMASSGPSMTQPPSQGDVEMYTGRMHDGAWLPTQEPQTDHSQADPTRPGHSALPERRHSFTLASPRPLINNLKKNSFASIERNVDLLGLEFDTFNAPSHHPDHFGRPNWYKSDRPEHLTNSGSLTDVTSFDIDGLHMGSAGMAKADVMPRDQLADTWLEQPDADTSKQNSNPERPAAKVPVDTGAYLSTHAPPEKKYPAVACQAPPCDVPVNMEEKMLLLRPSLVTGDVDYHQLVETLANAYQELSPILTRNPECKALTFDSSQLQAWDIMMTQFSLCAHATLKYAKKIPGFRKLPIDSQIAKVQGSMYQIVLTVLSTDYNLEERKYNYFNLTKLEEDVIQSYFKSFSPLLTHFHHMGHAIKCLNLDDTELSLLAALCLFMDPEQKTDTDMTIWLIEALERYCRDKYGSSTNRHGLILLRLSELHKANIQHGQSVIETKTQFPDLEIPQLFKETFLSDS